MIPLPTGCLKSYSSPQLTTITTNQLSQSRIQSPCPFQIKNSYPKQNPGQSRVGFHHFLTVVLNLAKSYVRAAARVPGHAADLRENEKHVKYDIALATALGPGNLIVPFAIEETGGWGTEFATEFKEWIAQLREEEREAGGEGWQATMTMLHWQQRVARALYSSLARRVVARARSVQPRHQQDAPLPRVQ